MLMGRCLHIFLAAIPCLLGGAARGFMIPSFVVRPATFSLSATAPPTSREYHLTVLIPAYNEYLRIENTLIRCVEFLESINTFSSDILVVDDGSTDKTASLVRSMGLECVSLDANQGKGAALAFGIHHLLRHQQYENHRTSNNHLILIIDADGSAGIERGLATALATFSDNDLVMLVGNRQQARATSLKRSILRWGFRTAVSVVAGNVGVQDTQCGFKLVSLPSAAILYSNLSIPGWAHDVEVLYRAKILGLKVGECPIEWQDMDGSKLVTSSAGGVVVASLKMLRDILFMRIAYEVGAEKLPEVLETSRKQE